MKTRMELWKTYREEIEKNVALKKAVHQTNEKVKVLYSNLIKVFPEYKTLYDHSTEAKGIELDDVETIETNNPKIIDEILIKIRKFERGEENTTNLDNLNFNSGDFKSIYEKIKLTNESGKGISIYDDGNTNIKTKFIKLGKGDVVKKIGIAIDGPSGSGKTTIARILADRLDYKYISTGLVYRGIAYNVIENNIDIKDIDAVVKSLEKGMIKLLAHEVITLHGQNITAEVRSDAVSQMASKVSAIPEVRKFALELQREHAVVPGIIMDGRDTTFNVMPNAELKIFLETSAEIRAKRRVKQNKELGFDTDYNFVLKEIQERDYRDRNRDIDPLHQTEDAILIDASDMSIEECVAQILDLTQKTSKN